MIRTEINKNQNVTTVYYIDTENNEEYIANVFCCTKATIITKGYRYRLLFDNGEKIMTDQIVTITHK